MKIAVLHNRELDGVICRFGQLCPERYSPKHVRMVAEVLRNRGHHVELFEADMHLLRRLARFMPADRATGQPTGLAFNMAYGIQGDARYTHLPAMLEMAGIPYTGSEPLGHSLAQDKVIAKVLMREAGIPTANFCILRSGATELPGHMRFPVIIKPRRESTSYGLRLANDRAELKEAVEVIDEKYDQGALVEEYIDGREVCVGLIGNDPLETLPIVELDFAGRDLRLMTWDDKYHKRQDEPEKVCPAPLDAALAQEIIEIAKSTFHACHVRDYGRVDIRIDRDGRPYVLEINSMASLGLGGSFVFSAKTRGYDFESLVVKIVEVASERNKLKVKEGEARWLTSNSSAPGYSIAVPQFIAPLLAWRSLDSFRRARP